MSKPTHRSARAVLAMLIVASASAAHAESVEDFYRGKQIQLIIGFGVGDGFDTYARVLARHMPRHIPGRPTIVVQNMPGVGSIKAAAYVQNIAPKDGTAFGLMNPAATVDALFDPSQSGNLDPSKFDWIGSMASDTTTCSFWTRTPVTLDTLRSRQFVVGGTSATSGTMRANRVLASTLGLKFKFVSGYRTLGDLTLAAEKGEVEGFCGAMLATLKVTAWNRYKDGSLQIPVQAAIKSDPDIPNVPNAYDLAGSEQDRQLLRLFVGPWYYARPFFAPSGIPADRLEALRSAFTAMQKDPAFLEEAGKIQLNVRALTGKQVSEAINEIYATPKAVIERAKPIMDGGQ